MFPIRLMPRRLRQVLVFGIEYLAIACPFIVGEFLAVFPIFLLGNGPSDIRVDIPARGIQLP
jgi:hypothetical protein